MKNLLLPACLLLLSTACFAGPCLPGTLQSYILLGAGGCQAGSVQFSNFMLESGQSIATPISAQQVQVNPGGTAFLPMLLFTLNSSASAGQVFESFFRFEATAPLFGATIGLNSASAAGDGAVTGVMDVCAGGMFSGGSPVGCPTSAGTAVAFTTSDQSGPTDSVNFQIHSFFDVFVDLTIDGGLAGSANLPSASVAIAAAPEPSASGLIAAGLGILGFVQMRRTRRP
jgi:hypothetical protein